MQGNKLTEISLPSRRMNLSKKKTQFKIHEPKINFFSFVLLWYSTKQKQKIKKKNMHLFGSIFDWKHNLQPETKRTE